MLRIRTFGGLVLEGGGLADGGATRQRRPLALLALLAAAGDAGVSRDRIVALLWAETETERAFNTLRQWLFQLRRDLNAPDAILGTSELRLNPAIISSDLIDFRAAIEAGELEHAVMLYRGPFLDGFHLPNAPEFERWQHQVAQDTATHAARMLERLASESGQRGDDEVAVAWWRRLAVIDPLNPRAAIGLMNALAASGDIAGAIRHARVHSTLIQHEIGLPADPAVQAAVDHLQATAAGRLEGRSAPPLLEVGEADASPVQQSDAAREGDRDVIGGEEDFSENPNVDVLDAAPTPARRPHTRTRSTLLAAVVAGALLLIGALSFAGLRRSAGNWRSIVRAEPTSPELIAILPFAVESDGHFRYLGEGMVSLLAADLDGAPQVRTVDAQAILSLESATEKMPTNVQHNADVAKRFGAARFVVGEVVQAGPRMQIAAGVYRTDDPGRPVTEVAVQGDSSQVLILADELARKLLSSLGSHGGDRLIKSAASVTSSLEAYRHYLSGEDLFRRGEYAPAVEAFQRAVSADTLFALAYYRLSLAADWGGQVPLIHWAEDRAQRLSSRLSIHDRNMLAGLVAWEAGRADEAERLYRDLVTAYPDDVDAWFQLGEVQFHLGPIFGDPVLESRTAFERALSFRPDNREALVHLLRLAAKASDTVQVQRIAQRLVRQWPTADTISVLALQAFAIGTPADQDRALHALASASDETVLQAANKVAIYAENIPGAERIAKLMVDDLRAPYYRVFGYTYLGFLAAAQGRRAKAESLFVALEGPLHAMVPGPTHVRTEGLRAFLYALPDMPARRDDLSSRQALIKSWRASAAEGPAMSLLDARLAPFVEGALDTRLGDLGAAERAASALLHVNGSPMVRDLAREMSTTVRALESAARGQLADALALLEIPNYPLDPARASELVGARIIRRYTRAVLLDTLGRTDDAIRCFSAIGGGPMADLMLFAPAQLRQAKLFERLGNQRAAAKYYQRFITLWRDADPELQPLVREALRRLERLKVAESHQ